jgi:ABC-type nickel/cobalt efflux system permease component RcnA
MVCRGESIKPGAGESGVTKFFSGVVSLMQDVTAIVSVLGICIVGIMYIMSRGDEEKTENAKKYMIAILIGLILALSAWAIISMVDLIPTTIRF